MAFAYYAHAGSFWLTSAFIFVEKATDPESGIDYWLDQAKQQLAFHSSDLKRELSFRMAEVQLRRGESDDFRQLFRRALRDTNGLNYVGKMAYDMARERRRDAAGILLELPEIHHDAMLMERCLAMMALGYSDTDEADLAVQIASCLTDQESSNWVYANLVRLYAWRGDAESAREFFSRIVARGEERVLILVLERSIRLIEESPEARSMKRVSRPVLFQSLRREADGVVSGLSTFDFFNLEMMDERGFLNVMEGTEVLRDKATALRFLSSHQIGLGDRVSAMNSLRLSIGLVQSIEDPEERMLHLVMTLATHLEMDNVKEAASLIEATPGLYEQMQSFAGTSNKQDANSLIVAIFVRLGYGDAALDLLNEKSDRIGEKYWDIVFASREWIAFGEANAVFETGRRLQELFDRIEVPRDKASFAVGVARGLFRKGEG